MTEPNLNLNDPNMLKAVLSASVTDVPNFLTDEVVAEATVNEKLRPAEQLAATLKERSETATFSTKLTAEELFRVKRMATDAGFADWKEFLRIELRAKLFSGPIASPRISRPSWAQGSVSGPSGK